MNTLQQVIEWLQETDPVVDREDVRKDLAYCFEYDGYEFCRNLENSRSWFPDAQLVEILDRAKKDDFAPQPIEEVI